MLKIGIGIGKAHKMGSEYFFKKYSDFVSKDTDYIVLVDEPKMFKTVMNLRMLGKDVFYWKRMDKALFIEKTLNSDPMCAGKFLIPEFCKDLGFTIEDLKLLDNSFQNMDKKHEYERIIYQSYLENNDFFLTDEQREKAYKKYKENKK